MRATSFVVNGSITLLILFGLMMPLTAHAADEALAAPATTNSADPDIQTLLHTSQARKIFADKMQADIASAYPGFMVSMQGTDGTELMMKYSLVNDAFVAALIADKTFIKNLQELGFKQLDFTDGNTYNVTKDVDTLAQ